MKLTTTEVKKVQSFAQISTHLIFQHNELTILGLALVGKPGFGILELKNGGLKFPQLGYHVLWKKNEKKNYKVFIFFFFLSFNSTPKDFFSLWRKQRLNAV